MVTKVLPTETMSLKQEGTWNKLALALMLHQKAMEQNRDLRLIQRLGHRIARLGFILEHQKAA